MFLKTITIHGFKSFADSTRLDLQPGVTAIVGPNGCGKSNIADAIRWVLGEQSAKALRGGKMLDVIFQGSEGRKAVPFCQVSLVFADCEKELGVQYHEVEVGRKVTREGGSDYFINGKLCRLKDIQSLFMDTGVGQVSYSFLLQGQIDQILSTNPMERRTIFEEAAGITRYKSQRKEALNKLGLVDQNLARVTDVIQEISKRIDSLKRQASKTLRYERLRHRRDHLDVAWHAFQFTQMHGEANAVKEQQEAAIANLERLRSEDSQLNRELEQRKIVRDEILARIGELRKAAYELRTSRDACKNDQVIKNNRIEDWNRRLEQLDAELANLRSNTQSIAGEDSEISGQMSTQHAAVANAEAGYREWELKIISAEAELRDFLSQIEERRQELMSAERQITHYRSQSTRLEVNLSSFTAKQEEFLESFHHYNNDASQLKKTAVALQEQLGHKAAEKAEATYTLEDCASNLRELEEELREARNAFSEIEKQHNSIQTEIRILEDLQKKLEGFGAGTKAIMQGALEALISPSEVSLFSRSIQIDADYQQFGETVLGSLVESMVYDRTDRLGSISRFLTGNDLGKASFLIPGLRHRSQKPAKGKVPEPLRPASDLIATTDPALTEVLHGILEGSYYIESLDDALNFVAAHPSFPFDLIATRHGEILTHTGCVHVGRSSGNSGSFLQRQNELRKLKEDMLTRETELHTRNEELDALSQKLDSIRQEREEGRDILTTVERELSNLRTEQAGVARNLATAEERVAHFRRQLDTLEQDRARHQEELSKVNGQLETAEDMLEGLKVEVNRMEAGAGSLRSNKETLLQGLSDARVALAEEKQRLNQFEQSVSDNKRRREELQKRLHSCEREQEHTRLQIRRMNEEIMSDELRHEQLAAEFEQAQATLNTEEEAVQEFAQRIQVLESQLSESREEDRKAQEEVTRLSLILNEREIYSRTMCDKIREDYDLNLETINWRLEWWRANQRILSKVVIDDLDEDTEIAELAKLSIKGDEPTSEELKAADSTNWEQVQEEIKGLKHKIQTMGQINPMAIEEYNEVRERYQFMKSQSDDLWASKTQLLQAIDEINKTSETMFKDTFEKIRTNFQETYHQLTGGGESDLELIDSEDLLDCGIEIIARPPGTRLRNLTLLSGGQKTMTAVALLFAIYRVKPSPFCVLDELDAPLDDANIGRFVEMLRDFTRFSQFLIVSHNKRTIASADSIFGVTMQEKGVSKLISMRFNTDRDLIDNMIEPERV